MTIDKRSAGILLHITSLPSKYGIGDLGPEAYKFADLLQEAGQRYWQLLPLNPTEAGYGNSPYSSHSAFAGNPLLISPDLLAEDGLLQPKDLRVKEKFPDERVDYGRVTTFKHKLLQKAYQNYQENQPGTLKKSFTNFQKTHKHWLQDFTLFAALKKHFEGKGWGDWPDELRKRDEKAMQELANQLSDEIEYEAFLQFLFYSQWEKLKAYCLDKDVHFFGDMPFYVSHDSADVWAHQSYFKLDKGGRPTGVSGVPPDFFSETGQLWGTPVYNWKELGKNEYDWWLRRIEHSLQLFSVLRLDHFRAFSAYWEVPATEKTAINGKWVKSPGHDILTLIKKHHPEMPIIAEDLGEIDQPVRDLIQEFNLPGMLILIFAFGDGIAFESSFVPHNHYVNSIVYTGTHDNSTVKAWYKAAKPEERKSLSRYVGQTVTNDTVHEIMNRLAYASVSQLAILPMQDILGLGKEGLMNIPSTSDGNWEWRLQPGQFSKKQAKALQELAQTYGRLV